MSALTERDFESLKVAAMAILEDRHREHLSKSRRGKMHAIYIKLTPGHEDAPTPELIVEQALADSNVAEAMFHSREAERFNNAINILNETTYEESN
ncbi:MAG: hypothetical protein M3536_02450 [Actinomycetota bacterium]|nr:hypothetical protein [Actinomycetota bacterium]